MGKVYCEFCGKEINGIRKPEALVGWTHNIARNVVRCWDHKGVSKRSRNCRQFNPLTGEKK